jgi:hypothetical protein
MTTTATVLQAGVNINDLAILGIGAVITIMILAVLAQVGLSYLGQRSLNDQLGLGMQAIVGSNNLRVVDNQQEDSVDDDSGGSGGT